jgi:hypothetical protein
LKEDLIKKGIPFEKIAVVPNAVNPDDFKHPEPDEEFIGKWNLRDKKIIVSGWGGDGSRIKETD